MTGRNTTATEPRQKALQLNLDARFYGTFAEIGAGQEMARWFFHAGGAAGTVAKTISAYDMEVSDAVYGSTNRYVSCARLEAMLEHEYRLLLERLDRKRGAETAFFVFADTVATRSYSRPGNGDGWMGVRFQHEPRAQPSSVLLHFALRDREAVQQQEAVGILGVNLLYGSAYHHSMPAQLIGSLIDGLNRERVELDMVRFSGPAFSSVDNRLMSLELVEQRLTDATLFAPSGEVVEAADVLHGKPLLVERGSFRPIVKPALDMLQCAEARMHDERTSRVAQGTEPPVVILEMTLHNLLAGERLEHSDFLDLVDMLGTLGKAIAISAYGRYDELTGWLRRHTKERIVFAMGIPGLQEVFDEKYYGGVGGGVLEALGRLFQRDVQLYVYPFKESVSAPLITTHNFDVREEVRPLYEYLRRTGRIQPLKHVSEADLHVRPRDVRDQLQAGDRRWEAAVPEDLVSVISGCRCVRTRS